MGRRSTIVGVAACLSLVLVAPTADADRTRFSDGNDARGPLDIARVAHAHRTTSAGAHVLVHTVRLHRAWPVAKLGKAGFLLLYFELPGNRDVPPERTLQVEREKGRLVARMYDTGVEPSDHLGRVRMRRPDGRTLRFSFAKSLLRPGLRRYKWNAVSAVERHRRMCRRAGGCVDWAPDSRDRHDYIRHVL